MFSGRYVLNLVVLCITTISVLAPVCATAAPMATWISETFNTSPFESDGGWWVVEGAGLDTGQFWYDAQDHALVTRIDSREETTKLVRALPRALGGSDSFEFGALLKIESNNYYASQYGFFEIAFGLINSETTGTDRWAGFGDGDDDTYDMVEWNFFPNISSWFSSPSMGVMTVGGRAGDAWYNNSAFNYGEDTILQDEIAEGLLPPTGLPFDRLLDVRVTYQPTRKMMHVTVREFVDGRWELLFTRVPPTNVSGLNPSFLVDRMAISLYQDAYNPSESDPSLTATVRYYGAYLFVGPKPLRASPQPKAQNQLPGIHDGGHRQTTPQ